MTNKFKLGDIGIFLVLAGMLVFFAFMAPNFFHINNFYNVSRQICTLGIVCIGMTIVMITGGIDLTVGYHISLANVLCSWMMVKSGMNPVAAVCAILAMGLLIGLLNGAIIVRTGVAAARRS